MPTWIAGAYAEGNPVDAVFAREEKKAQKAYAEQATNDLFTAIDKQDADAINVTRICC